MPEENQSDTETVPLLEERLRVGKDVTEKERLVLHKTVSAHSETVEMPVEEQELSIERIPRGEVVDAAPSIREEGEWLIVPVLEEVLVVEKRLVLKEELRIRRQGRTRIARATVPLRREEIAVERVPGGSRPSGRMDMQGAEHDGEQNSGHQQRSDDRARHDRQ